MPIQICDKMNCNQLVARGPAEGEKFHCYNPKDRLTRTIGRHTVPHPTGYCFYHANFRDGESINGKGGNHRAFYRR